jgi:hypothetical protein
MTRRVSGAPLCCDTACPGCAGRAASATATAAPAAADKDDSGLAAVTAKAKAKDSLFVYMLPPCHVAVTVHCTSPHVAIVPGTLDLIKGIIDGNLSERAVAMAIGDVGGGAGLGAPSGVDPRLAAAALVPTDAATHHGAADPAADPLAVATSPSGGGASPPVMPFAVDVTVETLVVDFGDLCSLSLSGLRGDAARVGPKLTVTAASKALELLDLDTGVVAPLRVVLALRGVTAQVTHAASSGLEVTARMDELVACAVPTLWFGLVEFAGDALAALARAHAAEQENAVALRAAASASASSKDMAQAVGGATRAGSDKALFA